MAARSVPPPPPSLGDDRARDGRPAPRSGVRTAAREGRRDVERPVDFAAAAALDADRPADLAAPGAPVRPRPAVRPWRDLVSIAI